MDQKSTLEGVHKTKVEKRSFKSVFRLVIDAMMDYCCLCFILCQNFISTCFQLDFFGSEMELGHNLSILVIAAFLIHRNRDLGLIYHGKYYFWVRNIHEHHLYAIQTS